MIRKNSLFTLIFSLCSGPLLGMDSLLPKLLPAVDKGIHAVKAELQKGANVNASDLENVTALFIASYKGKTDIVELLLNQPHIDINKGHECGATPLFVASQKGFKDVVQLLLKHPDIDVNKAKGNDSTPLLISSHNGHKEIVQQLLNHHKIEVNKVQKDGATPLYTACQQGHKDIVQLFLTCKDIDINKPTIHGTTPLFIACQNGHPQVVELLLNRPEIDVNKARPNGTTPLFNAAANKHPKVVELLLKHPDIQINKPQNDESTPLFVAAQEGCSESVRLLLAHKDIDINKAQQHGETPFYIACGKGHTAVAELLLEHTDINQKTSDGLTPFYTACALGHFEIANLLIKNGAHLPKTQNSNSLLHAVATYNHKNPDKMIKFLLKLKKGLRIHARDEHKATPLYRAAQYGNLSAVIALLKYKPSFVAKDILGNTAMDIAKQNGHYDIFSLLQQEQPKKKAPPRKRKAKRSRGPSKAQRQQQRKIVAAKQTLEKNKTTTKQQATNSQSVSAGPSSQSQKTEPFYASLPKLAHETILEKSHDYIALQQYNPNNTTEGRTFIIYNAQKQIKQPIASQVKLYPAYAQKHKQNGKWDTFHGFSKTVDSCLPFGIYVDKTNQHEPAIATLMNDIDFKELRDNRYAVMIPGKIKHKYYNYKFAMHDKDKANGGFSGAFVYIFDKKTDICCHRCFHKNQASKAYNMALFA